MFDETGIHGVFALFEGEDSTYAYIEGGRWRNNAPYIAIHRLAGDGRAHGFFQCAARYCKENSKNIRVDPHADNKIMQR